MKTNKSTMSHNACYDNKSRRWLVNVLDIVELDFGSSGEGVYFAYVSFLSIDSIEVVRIKDSRVFRFSPDEAQHRISRTRMCGDVVALPYEFREGVRIFSVGQSVIDTTFYGAVVWYISKFDFKTYRAFICREISGRTIGHWADLNVLVDFDRFKE